MQSSERNRGLRGQAKQQAGPPKGRRNASTGHNDFRKEQGKQYTGLSFSIAKPQEGEWIAERLGKLVGADAKKILEGKTIILGKRGGESEIFLVEEGLLPWFEKIKQRTDPQAIGFYLGKMKKDITLGVESTWKISKRAIIGAKAEQLALYGRDVFMESVIEERGKIGEGDLCVIANGKNEPLALGRMSRKLNIIRNLLDRGEYIRGRLY